MYPRILKYISVAIISLLLPFASYAQQTDNKEPQETVEDPDEKGSTHIRRSGPVRRPCRCHYEIPQFGLFANGSGRTFEFQGEIFSGF